MKLLYPGAVGPQVQLLQLALLRAGYPPGALDGVFGVKTLNALRRFQRSQGLTPDGVAGPATHSALRPWYTGYVRHTLRPGETFYRLALRYGSTVGAIELANPGLDPLDLRPGGVVTVPLSFTVVPLEIDWCSPLLAFCCEGLRARYPALRLSGIGAGVLGSPLWRLTLGEGEGRALVNACHHANEWITTPLLLAFAEELAQAMAWGERIGGVDARALMEGRTLAILPCVNPDGLDLVTGDLTGTAAYARAGAIAASYPEFPFPAGWKANIEGVDLNLQYPAGWEEARRIKFAQGFVSPAPRDYVGEAPLSAPESRAVYNFTRSFDPALTVSLHTQGEVIYWKYQDLEPPGAREIALRMARASGYAVEDVPYASGFAGYKDWFVLAYLRPGFTVELGRGENPLPISEAQSIYPDLRAMLLEALLAVEQG